MLRPKPGPAKELEHTYTRCGSFSIPTTGLTTWVSAPTPRAGCLPTDHQGNSIRDAVRYKRNELLLSCMLKVKGIIFLDSDLPQ